MRLRKTLAFEEGGIRKPERLKLLAFAVAMPLITSCAAHAIPVGRTTPVAAPRTSSPQPQQAAPREECGSGLESLLQGNERITERVCRFGREYLMTDTSLLIVTRNNQRRTLFYEPISLVFHASRTEMGEYLSKGIVDWEPAENAVYVLTNDRMLTALPNEDMGSTVPAYELPFETAGLGRNRMQYYGGFIFIAPSSGNAVVLSFADRLSSRFLPIRPQSADEGFFLKSGRLFFGRDGGASREIVISGPSVEDVGVAGK